jgi:hypothetical protein
VAVNSIYVSTILSYKYNLVLKSFSYGTQVMGHPVHCEEKYKMKHQRSCSKCLPSFAMQASARPAEESQTRFRIVNFRELAN